MQLNDLSPLMAMSKLELSWLMQSVPTWFHPQGRFPKEWAACVASLDKLKGQERTFAHGYGDTAEEAVLDAIDNYKRPPPVVSVRRIAHLPDIDLEIEL
jgi:hypothetical protein